MKLIELMEFIQDENRSEEFLRSREILKTFSNCINCGSDKLGMIRGDRWKCYSCKSEWTRRKDSLISLVRMKYSEFILCMKCFELELTAEETAAQLKINYKTVVQLFRNFRILISNEDVVNGRNESNILGKKSEMIGIYQIGEKFFFDFSASRTINVAKIKLDRKRISNSSTVLNTGIKVMKTPRVKQIFDLPPSFQKFIRFTKERLLKFRGTDRRFLELYLKEIEFRYNYSKVDVFNHLGVAISNNISRVVR